MQSETKLIANRRSKCQNTSAITVSMHCWSPLQAEPSALDIADAISSQEAAYAASTGSKSWEIEFVKYCKIEVYS